MAASPLRVQSNSTSGYGGLSYSVTLNGTASGNSLLLFVSLWEAGGDGIKNAIWLSGSGISGVSFTLAADSGPVDTGSGTDFERTRIYYAHGIPGGDITVQVDVNGGTQVALAMQEVSGLANAAPIATGGNGGSSTFPSVQLTTSPTVAQQAPYVVVALGADSPTEDNYAAGQPVGWWSDISIVTAASTKALHIDRRVPPQTEQTRINWGTLASGCYWSVAMAAFQAASGNTTLHLQDTSFTPVSTDAAMKDLFPAYGFSAVTTSTNTTAGGTEIQVTRSGTAVKWISPVVAEDVTLNGTIAFRVHGRESATANNVGTRVKLFAVNADGSNPVQIGSSAESAAELGTATALQTINVTASSFVLAAGKRLQAEYYVVPKGGTMAAATGGHIISYGGTTTAGGYIDLPQEVRFAEVANLALSGPVPSFAATTTAPATADLAITGPVPAFAATTTADATAALAITGPTPAFAASTVADATAAVTLNAPVPAFAASTTAEATAALAISGPTPTFAASTDAQATAALALAGPVPVFSAVTTEPNAETADLAITGPVPSFAATTTAEATAALAISGPVPVFAASTTAPGAETAALAIQGPVPVFQATVSAPAVDPPIAPLVGAWGSGTTQRIPRDGEGADAVYGVPRPRQRPTEIPRNTPLSRDPLAVTDEQRLAMLMRLQQQGRMTDAMRAELLALQALLEVIAQEDDDMAILLLAS